MRTHRAAVVLIPPPEVWEPIQRIRRAHDPRARRWMPHINLLYPFHGPADWPEARVLLLRAAAASEPFAVELARFRHFEHGPGRHTVWLEPEPAAPLLALHRMLREDFADCGELDRFTGGFTPHLSVGQFGPPIEERLAALQRAWTPLRFRASALSVIFRFGSAPFVVRARIPLGAPPP